MPGEPYFEFRNVWKSFDALPVLQDINFQVEPGETLCILGRSGVGKSVSLKLIMGFLRADQGEVLVNGRDVGGMTEAERTAMHRRVTMVFQSGALFDSMTVAENIAFPLRERRGDEAVSEADIDARVQRLCHMLDLDAYRDRYPDNLSTGVKRAVAIARALAASPEAVLYDEPTTMVDPIMSVTIADLIGRVKRQVKLTSIVVTHDTVLARHLADRLVMLHEGRVRFFGTVAEMEASSDPVLQEFLHNDELALP